MRSMFGKKVIGLIVTSFLIISTFGIVVSADGIGIKDRDRIQDKLHLQECVCDDVKVLLGDLENEIEEFDTDEDTEGFEDILERLEKLLNDYQIIDSERVCDKECLISDYIPLFQSLQDKLKEFIESDYTEELDSIKELIVSVKEECFDCKIDCICKYANRIECSKEQCKNAFKINAQNKENNNERKENCIKNRCNKK